jgi:hypothetical protein
LSGVFFSFKAMPPDLLPGWKCKARNVDGVGVPIHRAQGVEPQLPLMPGKNPLDGFGVFGDGAVMFNASQLEMPYIGSLTVKEKSKVAKLWEHLTEVRKITEQKGTILPQHLVADILQISKQRVGQLVDDGRLEAVEVHGVRYVTADSVEVCAKTERNSKGGRPRKSLDNRALWKASLESAKDIVKNSSKNC